MFNLGNLLITFGIATGVAQTTPVCDTKNENVVIDYEQTFTQVNTNSQTYPYLNIPLPDSQFVTLQQNEQVQKVTNYRSTSSFLNIIASKYETINQDNATNGIFIQNYEPISNNIDNFWEYTTTTMLVMQITTYNYNVGTKIRLRNTLNVEDLQFNANISLINSNRRFIKNVYRTTDNWSTYLQQQQRINHAQSVREAIEDVNNNFYYTKEQSLTEVLTIGSDLGYVDTDETELELLPNTTNYVVIEYIPIAGQEVVNTNTNEDYENTDEQLLTYKGLGITQSNYKIIGTNVIPDGTYEVIDIPGLMWQILTMPFAFVSQAFNLTLFPGTPYQINISNLFLSILAILAFVGLISMIVKMKG